VLRSLSVKPADRFGSMRELLDALAKDPAIRRRRIAAVLGAAALVTASVLSVRFAVTYRQELCLGAEAQLADIWDPPRRAKIEAALLAKPSENASNAWVRTREVLDRFSKEWVDSRTEACRATRVRSEQTTEVMGLRLSCLDQRLLEFGSLSRLLSTPDEQLVL
jgi:hypothetical protein